MVAVTWPGCCSARRSHAARPCDVIADVQKKLAETKTEPGRVVPFKTRNGAAEPERSLRVSARAGFDPGRLVYRHPRACSPAGPWIAGSSPAMTVNPIETRSSAGPRTPRDDAYACLNDPIAAPSLNSQHAHGAEG